MATALSASKAERRSMNPGRAGWKFGRSSSRRPETVTGGKPQMDMATRSRNPKSEGRRFEIRNRTQFPLSCLKAGMLISLLVIHLQAGVLDDLAKPHEGRSMRSTSTMRVGEVRRGGEQKLNP